MQGKNSYLMSLPALIFEVHPLADGGHGMPLASPFSHGENHYTGTSWQEPFP